MLHKCEVNNTRIFFAVFVIVLAIVENPPIVYQELDDNTAKI